MRKLAQMDMLKISFESKTEVQLRSLAKGLSVSTDKALWALRALWTCGSWEAFLIETFSFLHLFTLFADTQFATAWFFLCSVTVLPHQREWEWDPKNLSLLSEPPWSPSACIQPATTNIKEFSCAWRMLKDVEGDDGFPVFFPNS